MKNIFSMLSILFIALVVFLSSSQVNGAETPSDTILVSIMPAPTSDGVIRSYSPSGLKEIADQHLSDHHITVKRDGTSITVQMDTTKPFATVYFLKSNTPIHAVEIGADGKVTRDYPCTTIHVK